MKGANQMKEEEIKNILKAHKIYWDGLVAEDTALSYRSNNLLTFNSILAVAFVGILLIKGSDILINWLKFMIPFFAVILNGMWVWLGNRTMLSFFYYFKKMEEIEDKFTESELKLKPYLEYFLTAGKRREYWEKNKRCLIRLVSVKGGANKIFCFLIPLLIYIFWGILLTVFLITEKNCILAGVLTTLIAIYLVISIIIDIKLLCLIKNDK
jgi:hypothetical protein